MSEQSVESTSGVSGADAAGTAVRGAGTAGAGAASGAAESLTRPRIRTGAVLWGLVLITVGAVVLWLASSPDNREAVLDTVLRMGPLDWTVALVIALGATITLLALAAVIRRLRARR